MQCSDQALPLSLSVMFCYFILSAENPSLQDSDGKKKWSSKTELSSRSSSTLERPKKSVESVSDDEEERYAVGWI